LVESIRNVKLELSDLKQDISQNKQRENMFKLQQEEIQRYNEGAEKRLHDAIIRNKEMEDQLREEINVG